MGVGDAVEGDAASAHDGHVGVHLRERLDGKRADQHAEPRVDHPAGDEHLDAVVGAEVVGHGERVGDDVRGFPAQVLCCVVGGGARVDDHALVGLDQCGCCFTNRFFLVELMSVAGGKSELV